MIRSMTGFGACSVSAGGLAVRAEVRSVNHRYLQTKSRLPSDLGHVESEIEAAVREALERGAVTVAISVERKASPASVGLNLDLARKYKMLLDGLARELKLASDDELEILVGLPGVIASTEDPARREREGEVLLRAVRKALGALIAMREREGRSLSADLGGILRGIERVVARLEKRMPDVVRGHHECLTRRLNELLDGDAGMKARVSPADLARELALLADRMDVSEEFARLRSHLAQWRALLGKGGPVGRQLDFLVQEILREANTIGSKCNDAEAAQGVVELKTLIERLREQVQNVE